MMTQVDILCAVERLLDDLAAGCVTQKFLDEENCPEEWLFLVRKLNRLHSDMQEMLEFTARLSGGDMDAAAPPRENVMAAPVKELQSQMRALYLGLEQLAAGKIAGKLYHEGPLFARYNAVVDSVGKLLMGDLSGAKEADPVTSWRYHQVLAAINRLRIMMMEVDDQGQILFANPPVREAFPGITKLDYGARQSDPLLQYLCAIGARLQRKAVRRGEEYPILRELHLPGSDVWYHITSDVIPFPNGAQGYLHLIDDISAWKRTEQMLENYASIDGLTGTCTRRAGSQKLEELIETREEENNCAAFVDVDGLKEINDNYGHNEGDFAIKTIAEILLSCVRSKDWVIRFGGDEFLVLFLDCMEDMAKVAMSRMYAALEQKNQELDKPYKLSFSVGISQITPEMEHISDVIRVIDAGMYREKTAKKESGAR